MALDALLTVFRKYEQGQVDREQLDYAVQRYYISQNSGKPLVMRSLPPSFQDIELALNMAQCELRAMYKRLEIKGSNVLDLVDEILEKLQAAMPS